jgi:hypothetical protein
MATLCGESANALDRAASAPQLTVTLTNAYVIHNMLWFAPKCLSQYISPCVETQ